MRAILLLLSCSCAANAQVSPRKPTPDPVIPIPTGRAGADCKLYTDWAALTQAKRIWCTARWIDEHAGWESSVVGREGGRLRNVVREGERDRVWATTARCATGGGGVGVGVEWEVFVGRSWTAGLDVEFTANGPRIVIAAAYYPFEGITYRYGWSVLSGQFVHGTGWQFDRDELSGLYYWPRLWVLMFIQAVRQHFRLDWEE